MDWIINSYSCIVIFDGFYWLVGFLMSFTLLMLVLERLLWVSVFSCSSMSFVLVSEPGEVNVSVTMSESDTVAVPLLYVVFLLEELYDSLSGFICEILHHFWSGKSFKWLFHVELFIFLVLSVYFVVKIESLMITFLYCKKWSNDRRKKFFCICW